MKSNIYEHCSINLGNSRNRWFLTFFLTLSFSFLPQLALMQTPLQNRALDHTQRVQLVHETDSILSSNWSLTGSLNFGRLSHTATLLPNGKVLVVGGQISGPFGGSTTSSSEIYDPATGSWSAAAHLSVPRSQHTATLLPNGKVAVVGGSGLNATVEQVEIYDPVSGVWTLAGSLFVGRSNHTTTLLPNGKLLVAGGINSNKGPLSSSEVYDPATGTSETSGSFVITARYSHTATLLPNGKVLVAGGAQAGDTAELHDLSTGN